MAIIPETQYAGKITPASPEYPYGQARNITLPGDGTGTPWEAALVNDLFGLQQALLSEVGVVPSGDPDRVGASQYLTAMKKLSGLVRSTVSEIEALEEEPGVRVFLTDTKKGGPFVIKDASGAGVLVVKSVTSSSVDSATDTVTSNSHGLGDGDAVRPDAPVNGLTAGQTYWVVNPTANTFQLSTLPGGAVFDLTGTTNFTVDQLRDPGKGVYILTANGNYAERMIPQSGRVPPEWFDAEGDGSADDTIPIQSWWLFSRDTGLTPTIGSREKTYKYNFPLIASDQQDLHLEGSGGTLYGVNGAMEIGLDAEPSPERRIRFRSKGVSFKANDGAACILFKEFIADWIIEDAVFEGGWYHVDMVDALIGEFRGCVFRNSSISSQRAKMLDFAAPNLIIYNNCKWRLCTRIWDYDGGSVLLRDCDVEGNDSGAQFLGRFVNMGGGGSGTALILEGINWFEGNTGAGDIYFRGVSTQRQVIINNAKFISDTTTLLDLDICTAVIIGGSANTATATNHLILGASAKGLVFGMSFTPAKLTDNSGGNVMIISPDIGGQSTFTSDLNFGQGFGLDMGLPGSTNRVTLKGASSNNTILDFPAAGNVVFQTGGANKFRIRGDGSFGVSNVTTAAIPGSINRYFPVYDQDGNFVGNVPIYN